MPTIINPYYSVHETIVVVNEGTTGLSSQEENKMIAKIIPNKLICLIIRFNIKINKDIIYKFSVLS